MEKSNPSGKMGNTYVTESNTRELMRLRKRVSMFKLKRLFGRIKTWLSRIVSVF